MHRQTTTKLKFTVKKKKQRSPKNQKTTIEKEKEKHFLPPKLSKIYKRV